MSANFKGILPSKRTTESNLKKHVAFTVEVTIKPVKDYIIENHLPLAVNISEDCTSISGTRQYHEATNSVFGFSLPLQPDGLRDASLLATKTAEDIVNLFGTLPRASVMLVVMAHPFGDSSPPFRILCFASNNKFTTEDKQFDSRLLKQHSTKKVSEW